MGRLSRIFRGRERGHQFYGGDPIAAIGGADMKARWVADDYDATTGDWVDRVAGVTVSQASGAARPTKVTSPYVGVVGNGSQWLEKTTGSPIMTPGENAGVLVVANFGTISPARSFFITGDGGHSLWQYMNPGNIHRGNVSVSPAGAKVVDTVYTPSVRNVFSLSHTATEARNRVSGTTTTSASFASSVTAVNSDDVTIFGYWGGGAGLCIVGTIHEVVLGTFDDTKMSALEAALIAKWGV